MNRRQPHLGFETVKSRDDLFARAPRDIPNWMAIRDADDKRRRDKEAKLRTARLDRDAREAAEQKLAAPVRRKPRPQK